MLLCVTLCDFKDLAFLKGEFEKFSPDVIVHEDLNRISAFVPDGCDASAVAAIAGCSIASIRYEESVSDDDDFDCCSAWGYFYI